MKEKTITKSLSALQVEASEKSLPDESDQIISELKSELSHLKEELLQVSQTKDQAPTSTTAEPLEIQLEIKRHQVSSLLKEQASHQHQLKAFPKAFGALQQPFAQMEAILNHVEDPEVKEALKHCQNSVVDAFQGLQSVSNHSKLLDQIDAHNTEKIDLLSFFKQLAQTYNQQHRHDNKEVELFMSKQAPTHFCANKDLFQEALITLLKQVAALSEGEGIKLVLKQGKETLYNMDVNHLKVSLLGETDWQLPQNEELSAFLDQMLENTETRGMDVIYAIRVIEEHGGSFSFHREEEKVTGFHITVPLAEE